MNNRERLERLISMGFKQQFVANFLNNSSTYIKMYRDGRRELSPAKEKMLTEFLDQYNNIFSEDPKTVGTNLHIRTNINN